MKFIDKIRRRRFFRYDLFVNGGDGWKKFGDFKEYLAYKDIENPDTGSVLRFYGVFKDLSQKDGWSREMLWEKEVPTPGGGKSASAGGGTKEKPIEERLMEKIIEGADFSNLKPHKMSVPLGKSGGSLEFESPVNVPVGDGSGYMVIDGNRYPMGDMPALEFEGKLPAWLHPAAGAMITSFMDRAGGFIKGAIGSAITETTGIKAKNPPAGQIAEKAESIEKPTDAVDELDALLEKDEKNRLGKDEKNRSGKDEKNSSDKTKKKNENDEDVK